MKESVVESLAKAVIDLSEKIRVLHVDDDSGILKITKQCLELEGPVEVDTAVSVDEAMTKLEKEQYDVVVSDYQMPIKDGLDLLKELREKGNTIPFIMFTGKGREEVAIKALNLGANQYLNKVGATETVYTELAHSITELAKTRKAERRQCESEEKFRTLFEKANDGLVFTDVSGRVVELNQKATEIAEKKKEDIIGKSFLDLNFISTRDLPVLAEKLRQQAIGKPTERFEFEIERENGEKRLIEVNSTPIQKNNMLTGFLAIVRDITERKRMEEELKQSEQKLRSVVYGSPIPAFFIDKDHKVLYWNVALEKYSGLKAEDVIGTDRHWAAFYQEKRPCMADLLLDEKIEQIPLLYPGKCKKSEFVEGGYEATDFSPSKGKNGAWLHFTAVAIRDSQGSLIGALEMLEDITERKKAEEALWESEAELRAQFYGSPDLIMILDRKHRYVRINRTHFLSYDVGKLLGEDAIEPLPPDQRDLARTSVDQCFATGNIQEFEHTLRNGEIMHARVVPMQLAGTVDEVMVISANITERKKAEEMLKEIKDRLELQIKVMPIGCVVWDRDFKAVSWNPAAETIFQYSAKEAIGKHPYDIIVPKEAQPAVDKIWQRLLEGDETAHSVNDNVTKDGKTITCSWTNTPLKREDGSVMGVLSMVQDITSRQKAEEELKSSHEKLRLYLAAARASIDGFVMIDMEGRILNANNAVLKIYGAEAASDIIGKSCFDLVGPEEREKVEANMREVMANGKSSGKEFSLITRKGARLTVDFSTTLVRDAEDHPVGFLGIIRDVTEGKKAEEALRESEERCSRLSAAAFEGIGVSDQGKITDVNDQLAKMLGYEQGELIGKAVLNFVAPQSRDLVMKNMRKGYEGPFEYLAIRKDGSVFPVEIRARSIHHKGHTARVCAIRDVTEHKKKEEALEESEEKLRGIIDSSSDFIFLLDRNSKLLSINKAGAEIRGKSPQELIGKSAFERFPETAATQFSENVKNVFDTGKSMFLEEKMVVNGRELYNSTSLNPVRDSRGRVTAVAGIVRDITERKKIEEELSESEEKFRDLYEGIRDPISIFVGREGHLIDYNKAFKRLFGYTDEELKDKTLLDLTYPDDRALVMEKYRTTYPEEQLPLIYEIRGVNKKGEAISLETTVSTYKKKGRVIGIEVILRDITQRKRMEEELRESEERFRDLYEGIHDPVAIYVGKEGRLVDYNSAYKKLSGFTDEELKYKTFLELTHPDDRAKVLEKYRTDYSEDKFPIIFEVRGINKNGGTDYLEASVSPYKRKGKVIGVEVINRDITERKRMEEELRESEQKLRDLYESIPDGVAVYVGKEGRLLECNKAFKKHYGYTDEELKDKGFLDFIAPEDHAVLLKEYRTDYPEEKLPFKFETRAIDKKGEIFPIEISVGPYKKKGRIIGVNVVHRDITERKAMESKLREYADHLEEMVEERTKELNESQERLVKSERLAAIGHLAAMVGHDLRNPLTGIKGAAYYLKTKLGSKIDVTAREMLEVIEKDVEYSDKIIGDLLEYSREIRLELTETTTKSILKDALSLIKVPESVQILELTENEPEIKIDNDKMKRVFVNIIRNAIDAMSEGGRLKIKSGETNGNLEISFADSGVGMSKETMEKLWTPLFTTKAKGIGLGLSICKRIVEAHGGKISVESEIGKGTTITIAIPVKPKTESGEELWVDVPKPTWSLRTKAQ